jgi:hypothetical protein
LLESIALGTAVAVASVSAAFTGADNSMAQVAAMTVNVANFGDLIEWLLERIAFIKIVTLFNLFGCYSLIGR